MHINKIPKKEKKCIKTPRHSNPYLTHAKKIYKEISPAFLINPKLHNPFKLRYTKCKPTKRTESYFQEINKIITQTNYWIYRKQRCREFNRFLQENMKQLPTTSESLQVDPLPPSDPEMTPKEVFFKKPKPEKFPRLTPVQDSYFLLLTNY